VQVIEEEQVPSVDTDIGALEVELGFDDVVDDFATVEDVLVLADVVDSFAVDEVVFALLEDEEDFFDTMDEELLDKVPHVPATDWQPAPQ